MSAADDYCGEMPSRQIDDATAEQLLGGRRVPAELESVATVVRALREVSTQPVRPSDTLRRQMAAGAFPGSPAYAYRPGSRDLLRRVATVLVIRIGRLRLGTKLVAAGAAVAVLSVGSAGFAGTLPAPVQSRFETVVESVTPYQFPEKTANPGGTEDGGVPDRERTGEPDGGTTDRDPPGRGPDAGPDPSGGPGNGNGHGPGNDNGNSGSGNDGNGNGDNGSGNGNRDRGSD